MRIAVRSHQSRRVQRGDVVTVLVDGASTRLEVPDTGFGPEVRWLLVDVPAVPGRRASIGDVVGLDRF